MGVHARIRDEGGFTLIELLVVAFIIGILAAIGLMSLTKQGAKAQDAEAKSNARNIIAVVEACNTREDDYRDCESSDNPGIRDAGIALGGGRGQVVVTSSDQRSFRIVSRSRSGNLFTLTRDDGGAAIRTCAVIGEEKGGCSEAPNGTW
jgi:prepilin-type N-terminal cleavage/methylation domain-containing protein